MTQRSGEERAPYNKAADALRQDIAEGRLKAGDKLPALSEIEKRFTIANMTARRAVQVLREENLVYAVQGVGTFVRATVQPEPAAEGIEAGGETVEVSAAELAKITDLVTGMSAQLEQFRQELSEMRARVEQVEQSAR